MADLSRGSNSLNSVSGCVINLFLLLLLIILQAVCCVYFEIIAFLHLADFQVLICRIYKIFKQSKLSYFFNSGGSHKPFRTFIGHKKAKYTDYKLNFSQKIIV